MTALNTGILQELQRVHHEVRHLDESESSMPRVHTLRRPIRPRVMKGVRVRKSNRKIITALEFIGQYS